MKTTATYEDCVQAFENLRPGVLNAILGVCKLAGQHVHDIETGIETDVYASSDNVGITTSHDINEKQVVITVPTPAGKNPKEAFADHILSHVCPHADHFAFRKILLDTAPAVQRVDDEVIVFKCNFGAPGNALSQLFNRVRTARDAAQDPADVETAVDHDSTGELADTPRG